MTKEQLINELTVALKSNGFESARFEAKEIVQSVLKDTAWNYEVTPEQVKAVEEMLQRRFNNEPLQYILGEWEFYGLPFKVGSGVLIPRQDTEVLVETVLPLIQNGKSRVFDLCAGSGCIGITLAKLTDANVTLFEKSEQALSYLKENVRLNNVAATVLQYDVLGKPYSGKADIIVSNPPYIKTKEVETLQAEVKHEPRMALDGGEDGLIFYRRIATDWYSSLEDGGYLVFEIGYDQGDAVTQIMQNAGYREVRCKKDLGGNDRVVIGQR